MIDEYYGDHEKLAERDVRDSGIEYEMDLMVNGINGDIDGVTVTIFSFQLNSI